MAKVWAVLLVLATFLMVAPVIESETSGATRWFQGIATAESGGGGD
jgi:cell division protein FtsW (lipid II flippase)